MIRWSWVVPKRHHFQTEDNVYNVLFLVSSISRPINASFVLLSWCSTLILKVVYRGLLLLIVVIATLKKHLILCTKFLILTQICWHVPKALLISTEYHVLLVSYLLISISKPYNANLALLQLLSTLTTDFANTIILRMWQTLQTKTFFSTVITIKSFRIQLKQNKNLIFRHVHLLHLFSILPKIFVWVVLVISRFSI